MESSVRQMMNAMSRRGPDSEGFEAWPGIALGHRRLAILDLSPGGHQPMLSADRNIGVVFNGCIYNFLELRKELEEGGFGFRSTCDTEVLVHGYTAWGVDELSRRLRGMFAFAVWDNQRRLLSLVRDRLGVKPLVYTSNQGEFAFASTVGALKAGGFRGSVDKHAVAEYLEYGNVSGAHSIYEGVHKATPGTILEWKDGTVTQRTYWTLPRWDEASPITFDEAVEETERIIVEATRLRLCSDVPLSALLSGGIDSTLVCWALGRLKADVTAFTFSAPGDPSDESAQAVLTARQLGIPHQVVELSTSQPPVLEEIEDVYSEPFASQSAQAMLGISRAVKPLATVMLTGDGGDDVFLGYPFIYNAWRAERFARMMPGPALPVIRGIAQRLPRGGAHNFLGYATSGISAYIQAHPNRRYLREQGILGDDISSLRLSAENVPASVGAARRLFTDVLEHQQAIAFLGEFMPKVDGATMYHSVESRSPFLDQKLWEFAASLPPRIRYHGSTLKAVLREIVRRRVNPQLSSRPKQGFTVPVERWLATHWSGSLDLLSGATELEQLQIVRPGSLRGPIAASKQAGWVPQPLWYLLVLEHWLQRQKTG
jgi:asparagine synthase (glutamine-hydrolysing)